MKTTSRELPRPFAMPWGMGEIVEEATAVGEWSEPSIQLLRYDDGTESIRFCQYDHRGRFRRSPMIVDGKYFRTKEAKLFDKPPQPIPLLIAAGGPQAATLAGREGDGIIVTSGKGAELYRDLLLPAMEKGAREAGRDPAKLERTIEMKVSYDHDRAHAMADTKEWAALALPAEDKAGVEDPREMERRATAAADRAHTRFIVSTDPDEHVAAIRPYLDWGFRHLVFHFPGQDQERAMRLYAQEVLPRLRAEWRS